MALVECRQNRILSLFRKMSCPVILMNEYSEKCIFGLYGCAFFVFKKIKTTIFLIKYHKNLAHSKKMLYLCRRFMQTTLFNKFICI